MRLVDFLKDYDAQKNPPVTDIDTYRLFSVRAEQIPAVDGVMLTGGAESWLSVDFVDLPAVPPISDDLRDYLPKPSQLSATARPDPTVPDADLEPLESDLDPLDDNLDPLEFDLDPLDADLEPLDDNQLFDDSAATREPTELGRQRLDDARRWVVEQWEPWSRAWRDAQLAKEFYRQLFEQQQLVANDRETYELVWGFARVSWSVEGLKVNHPLFTSVVEVVTGEDNSLVVSPVEPLEVETLPFANVNLADRTALGVVRETVAADPFDPWLLEILGSRARTVVRALHHDGIVSGEGAEQADAPVVDTGWVLYTRRRRPDRQGFLDAMRELYASGIVPPDALSSIVVDAPSAYAVAEAGLDGTFGASDEPTITAPAEPLLLPLLSNEEQQRILTLAQRQSGVIVQGPPGTGKSHTIANLISHYLAYGHRVLVVAEKEQALSVLGDKIPAEIRELAVAVLGADASSRRELEAAIGSIQGRVSSLNRPFEDRRIVELTADLAAADAAIAETTGRLLAVRRSETGVLPGSWPVTPASPERAAAWVAEQQERLGYIPDPLQAGARVPLTGGELAELLRLLSEVGPAKARQSAFVLPDLAQLPTDGELAELLARRDQLRGALAAAAPEVQDWAGIDATDPARIAELRSRLEMEARAAAAAEQPWLSAIAAQQHDRLLAQDWRRFLDELGAARQQILALRPRLASHHIELPATADPSFLGNLEQARQRLAQRGKLGMFAGELKQALDACRVDGMVPATAEAIALCQQQAHLTQLRWELRTRWINQVGPFRGPDIDPGRPEDGVGVLHDQLAGVLDTPNRWAYLVGELTSVGIHPQARYSSATIARLLTVAGLAATRGHERAATARLDDLARYLADGGRQQQASPLWQLLADSLSSELPVNWAAHRAAVADLVDISVAARRLIELGNRLHDAAPVWANAIYADPAAAGDPSALPQAWQWRQLDTWVHALMAGDDPQDLQKQLEELTDRRRRLVAELVGVQAWRRLADNLGDRQRQALNRYLAATKRFGKTGGKFAARWLAEIRAALNESKDAVPVWIMTTARALASFRPDVNVPFDVIIVDEASQIGIEALPLLALAKRAIVVGDDKQTSPGAVGVDQQAVFDLIDAHLSGIPGHRVMFNPGNSLYDLARQKFPSLVMLREHFRCLPEIIAFSNTMFYDDKVEPLRENRPSPGWPALGAVKVLDGYLDRRTDTNEPEANVVADLVAKMIDDPGYDGMDFGVVCLRAGAQSELINHKLFDRLGPQVMIERRLRVGDAPNFQGDERDVMVVATVVGTDPANPAGRIAAMTSLDAEQRINVAASRARNQMIAVHSVDPERFPNNDLRAALIRHCRAPLAAGTDTADALARCDSEFERMVLRRIIARGYARVRSQVHVGTGSHSYRIDLVVDGPESRLAVECDGERWHGDDRWYADRARQEVLERAGWKFCRIRGSAFFRDPDAALQPLWERLDELGIPTGDDWLDGTTVPQPTVLELRGFDAAPAGTVEEDIDAGAGRADEVAGPGQNLTGEHDDPMRRAEASPVDSTAPAPASTATVPIRDASPGASGAGPATDQGASAASVIEWGRSSSEAEAMIVMDRDAGSAGRHRARPALAPYRQFRGGPFVPAAVDARAEIAAGLRQIVAAEGPILARRAYQLYVQASGGQRVGSEIKRILNKVTYDQIRNDRLAYIDDNAEGLIDRTLYLPGTDAVVVRELGPRDLIEVPKSEIRALIAQLNLDGQTGQAVSRAVLDAYGLTRLGGRTAQFLLDCQRYTYNPR